jgi:hypothetical protein
MITIGRRKPFIVSSYSSFTYTLDKKFDLSDETMKGYLLPMVIMQKKSLEPVHSSMKIKNGNLITFLINEKNIEKANKWLGENGFESKKRLD